MAGILWLLCFLAQLHLPRSFHSDTDAFPSARACNTDGPWQRSNKDALRAVSLPLKLPVSTCASCDVTRSRCDAPWADELHPPLQGAWVSLYCVRWRIARSLLRFCRRCANLGVHGFSHLTVACHPDMTHRNKRACCHIDGFWSD